MKTDEVRWDERYQNTKFPDSASDLVRDYHHLANGDAALDIAAGNGRNAVFLAEMGFRIDAVDISGVAMDIIQRKSSSISCFHEDLDRFTPKEDSYDLIININYLNRRLFPHIKNALRANGILIFNTFLDTHFRRSPQPHSNRDHYLQSNELLHAFLSLQILMYKEEEVTWSNGEKREAASLVARKMSKFEQSD